MTRTQAHSRTHTQKPHSWLSQRAKLEARVLFRDCLARDDFCGSSVAAEERGEKTKNVIFLRFP